MWGNKEIRRYFADNQIFIFSFIRKSGSCRTASESKQSKKNHGSDKVEVIWTMIFGMIMMFLMDWQLSTHFHPQHILRRRDVKRFAIGRQRAIGGGQVIHFYFAN